MQKFRAHAGLKETPPRNAAGPAMERMGRNVEQFLAHGLRSIGAFVPDIAALRAGAPRIVVASGEASVGQLAHRTTAALAERLGSTVVPFPGDHGGFLSHAQPFADKLHDVLART
jgi:hypothetical protein